jgi:hypothetical protein
MSPTYDPKGGDVPRKPILSVTTYQMPTPARTFGRLDRKEPPLGAICPKGSCMLQSSKEQPVPHCSGKCRLAPDPDKADPVLPKPPNLPKG